MDLLEILIVIDGSPDNSLAIARQYEANYPATVKVIEKVNGGHGSTINSGLELAAGKYFRVLDSDDWFDTDAFTTYLEKLNEIDVDVILTRVTKVYANSNEHILQSIDNIKFDNVYNGNDFEYVNYPVELFSMARSTYKTDLLRTHNLRLLEKACFEDTFLHIFLLLFINSFVCYDLNIYQYFLGRSGQSVSSDAALKHYKDWHHLINQMVDFYTENERILTPNKKDFVIKALKFYISQQYSSMNNLDYQTAKKELAQWHQYISGLSFSSQVGDYKRALYSFLPYFMYRFLYFFRVRLLNNIRTQRGIFFNKKAP
jgi:glycosyltransferase involved in cell wall biosynthesis